jgi:hypothetical protein
MERFLSFLTFYPPKKVAQPLLRVEQKFFEIVCKGYEKKLNPNPGGLVANMTSKT